ncbi:hypothetical protein FACS1894191_2700 [Clostridia bacterium]|nr:hypothetical protein FACS1894191_2700 [Clostridia bacterium]
MIKKIVPVALSMLLCLPLTGCWDYKGLDELTVVAGLAVDKGKTDPSGFTITLEIVDTGGSASDAPKSTMLETEGPTIFQAIHNASAKLYSEVYFGNTDVLVVSKAVAEEQGLNKVIDALLRDASTRDTLSILISRGETAGEIITPHNPDDGIASYNISRIINQDTKSLNSARVYDLMKVYNQLAGGRDNIALPAFGLVEDNGELWLKTQGAAIFSGDKLTGFAENWVVPYMLFVTENVAGGSYTFFMEDDQYATLSILTSKPKISFSRSGDSLTLHVDIKLNTSAIELSPNYTGFSGGDIAMLESRAATALNAETKDVINRIQEGSGSDIFGFGEAIYHRDPAYWSEIRDDWKEIFRSAEIVVNSDFTISDTGHIKNY